MRNKKYILPITSLLIALSGVSLPAYAEEAAVSAESGASLTLSTISAFELLQEQEHLTLPATWNEAAKQIYTLLGISAEKTAASLTSDTASEDSSSRSGRSYLSRLISLGYLEEAYSEIDGDSAISDSDYAALLDEVFSITITSQEAAELLSSSAGPVLVSAEELLMEGVSLEHLASIDSVLSLKDSAISTLVSIGNGTLTLENTQINILSLSSSEDSEIRITGDSSSSVTALVVDDADTLVIDGTFELDYLVITGHVDSLTVHTDCEVINQSGETLIYVDNTGAEVTLESESEETASSERSREHSSGHSGSSGRSSSGHSSGSSESSGKSGSRKHSSRSDSDTEEETTADAEDEATSDAVEETTADEEDETSADTVEETTSDAEDETSADSEGESSADTEEETIVDAEEETSADAAEETSSDTVDETAADVEEETSADAVDETSDEAEAVSSDEKILVSVPLLAAVTYTGELQKADISDCEYYTVTINDGGTEPGTYYVTLTLTDPELYRWESEEETEETAWILAFVIYEASEEAQG